MKYKLICSDIDGTLVDQDGRIPEENLKAIKRLREEGVLFAICSYSAVNGNISSRINTITTLGK